MSAPALALNGLSKTYASGHQALKSVTLSIARGEIFALLGPNGAGKTTLIGLVCGLLRKSAGEILVDGEDTDSAWRRVRAKIGLVPQELTTDAFETVRATVAFSRGLFGKPRNDALVEKVLRDLSLWDKRDSKIMTLSGGMKRRVMIAKALAHEPQILFLDEPTAGVDVELRQDMWNVVRELRNAGVTIILTTHYIEEAEEMADRIGIMTKGELMLVEDKTTLLAKLGRKQLVLHLARELGAIPDTLAAWSLELSADRRSLAYTYDTHAEQRDIAPLLNAIQAAGIAYTDLETRQSSLEDIFVGLVRSAT